MGHLTGLLKKITPAIEKETATKENRTGDNAGFVRNVTLLNVEETIADIRRRSSIIKALEDEGQLKISGGIYDVETGNVAFFE